MKLKEFYFVTLPIGNYEDITLRALKTLNLVEAYLGETTKATRKNLDLLRVDREGKKIFSIKDYPKLADQEELLKNLLFTYEKVAMVVDVGMPILADPGHGFFTLLLRYQIKTTFLGGVSSVPLALAYSNFPVGNFYFAGFMPRKKMERSKELKKVSQLSTTVIVLESHHRLGRLLLDLKKHLGDKLKIYIGFALTTKDEKHFRGPISEAIKEFDKKNQLPFVLVFNKRA